MATIQYDTDNGTSLQPQTLISKTDDGDRAVKMSKDGLLIEYDVLTTQKTFEIGQNGFNWTDGTNTYTTTLGRISAVQTALQAVELPPNATTLELNNTLKLNAGATENADLTQNGLSYTTSGGTTTTRTWADIIASTGSTNTLQQVLDNGNSATGASATISLTNSGVGGLANPSLVLTNSNATINTIPTIELNKTGRNLTAGESIGSISMYGLDAVTQKTEFARIQTKAENVSSGNEDGTLSIFNSVNGVISETFNFNGGQNENNTFRPLDLNGNALRTTAGDLSIQALSSSGTGTIFLQPKTTASVSVSGNMTIPFTSYNFKVGDISTQQATLASTGVSFNDSVNLYASSLSNTTMSITNGTTNQQTQLTTNQLYINDITNTKSIQINNDAGGGNQNRIDLLKNQGGGIYNQSGIVNDTSTQNIFLLYQDNANGRSLNIANDSANGGEIIWSNTTGSNGLAITSDKPLTFSTTDKGIKLVYSDATNIVEINSQLSDVATNGFAIAMAIAL